jgi:UDP-GlcNAc:undecaprenyl-phosphate GlcNAc-1-phosphate transferase
VFLGDAGSHLLGFWLGALTMAAVHGRPAGAGAAEVALWAGVPLFELVFLVVVRTRKGLRWWRGSPDHFSLRLQAAGLSRTATDAVACCFAVLLAGAAALMPHLPLPLRALLLAAAGLLLVAAGRVLLRWEAAPGPRRGAG